MKKFLIPFAAVLSALVVGLIGYEWYKYAALKQSQNYRTAAYLSQSLAVMSPMRSVTDMAWQMTGELPCSADDYAAAGFRPPGRKPNSSAPWVDVTGCAEFALMYSEFDGTPSGRIVMKATLDQDAYGTSFSWSCTSPSYESIEEYFPWCQYVKDETAEGEQAKAPEVSVAVSTDAIESEPHKTDSCGTDTVIYRSIFTEAVDDRTPQNRIVAIGPSREEVFFFTEIVGASGKQVSHDWFHNGIPLFSMSFDVKGDRWRTWSSKRIAQYGPGTLHVEVRDDRCLIGQESVRILDEEPDKPSMSGFMSPYKAIEAVLANDKDGEFASVVTMTPVGELYRFDDGDTPLHRAIRTGNLPAVRALLEDAKKKQKRDIPRGLQILYDYDASGRQAIDLARDKNETGMITAIERLLARSWPEWAVSRATFTTAMSDGEPVDCRSEAYDDEKSITFFAELTDMADRQVKHEWIFDDRVVQTNEFFVGSDRWTTRSTHQIPPGDTGWWKVRVTTADGEVIHLHSLRYAELNDINIGRRETYGKMRCDIGAGTLTFYAMAYAPIARFEVLLQKSVLLEPRIDKLAKVAVEGRNISLLRWLLTKGFAIDDYLDGGDTLLTLASEFGDANMVSFLLRQGADIEKQAFYGTGPLNYAALHGNSELTQILLKHGANPNGTDSESTPLRRAVFSCDAESIRLLLEYGAEFDTVDRNGDRPIDLVENCLGNRGWTGASPGFVLLRDASAKLP
jgi:hypothetical protein